MNKTAIGNNIRNLMQKNNMDSIDLANRLYPTPYATIVKWISGARQPTAYGLYRIAKVFGESMEKLMEGIEDEKG